MCVTRLRTENGLLGSDEPVVSPAQRAFQRKDSVSGAPLLDVVRGVKPTILLGLTGRGGVFSEAVVKEVRCDVQHVCNPAPQYALSCLSLRASLTMWQAYWVVCNCD